MVLRLPDSWSNLNLEMLVFEERGKQECPENTSRSKGENQQQTQPTYGVVAGFGFGLVSVRYLFYQRMAEKIKTWTLRFPAQENPNMEKALFGWPIVL